MEFYIWIPFLDKLTVNVIVAMLGLFLVVIFLSLILYFTSAKARYYFKFIYFILASLIGATLPIPLMLLKPRDSDNALLPAWGLRSLSKFMDVHFSVRGKENIVKDSGCVVLINHQSALDLIVLAELWPIMDKCTVISKKEVFYLGPFGLATWLWGTIFIDRLNPEKAQNAINTTGATIRERKARVLMFPEGTRHGGLELLPFKKGAFHLAIASRCPIQPVVVSNYYFLDDKTFKFDGGESIITILPPISTEGLTKEDLPELMENARTVMTAKYKEVSNEVQTKFKNNNNSKHKIN